jgi:hypothetical protein
MTHLPRRSFLAQSTALAALAALKPFNVLATTPSGTPQLTPAAEILTRVNAARPLLGGGIPAGLKNTLGVTHYDGHYHLTDKPFLIEGAEAIRRLGMNVAKFWLHEDGLPGYGYNTDETWKKSISTGRLVDVLKHRDYVEALSHPFTTVLLEVFALKGDKSSFFEGDNDFKDEEGQFYEVAAYLFKTYAERDITFILQNWEGDWMLRREEGGTWGSVPEAEKTRRCEAFIRFLEARQRGVDRARREAGASQCKVYHAAEVNRVWDGTKGLTTLTTHVLPHVTVDLVSWSCYDGLADPVATWQGIELIRHSMRPSPTFGKNAVFIGEVGRPEHGLNENDVVDFWDRTMGVFLAMDIPWVVHWELYCNEPLDAKTKQDRHPRRAEEMNGFWLLRPDGSLSYGGKYLTSLLQNAGEKLPAELLRPSGP